MTQMAINIGPGDTDDPRRLLRTSDIAALCDVSEKTVRKYRIEKGLPAIRFGNEYRYQLESVLRWLDEQEER